MTHIEIEYQQGDGNARIAMYDRVYVVVDGERVADISGVVSGWSMVRSARNRQTLSLDVVCFALNPVEIESEVLS